MRRRTLMQNQGGVDMGAMEYLGQRTFMSDKSSGKILVNELLIDKGYAYLYCHTSDNHMMFFSRNPGTKGYYAGYYDRSSCMLALQYNNYFTDDDGLITCQINGLNNYGVANVYDVYRYKATTT